MMERKNSFSRGVIESGQDPPSNGGNMKPGPEIDMTESCKGKARAKLDPGLLPSSSSFGNGAGKATLD